MLTSVLLGKTQTVTCIQCQFKKISKINTSSMSLKSLMSYHGQKKETEASDLINKDKSKVEIN